WQFPKAVDGFSREMQPYNIDGNSDAGAEYRTASAQLQAAVEIYAADSAAPGATLDGARAGAIAKAGDTKPMESEQPFQIEDLKDGTSVKGVKLTYFVNGTAKATHTSTGKLTGPVMNLYFFTTDRWRVKVLARA